MFISEVGTAHPYHRLDAVLEELSMMFYRSGNASKWLVLPVTVYMKNFLRHRTLCPTFKESMSDILLHFPDILDVISLNFRCFHRTLCPTF